MAAAANAISGVTAVVGDAQRLLFPDNEFDLCTARHMLYHLPEPVAALADFRRITRSGGTVAVVVNHGGTCHRTHELVASHARDYGLRPPDDMITPASPATLLPS